MPNLIKRFRKGRTQLILGLAFIFALVLGIPWIDVNQQSRAANPYINATVVVSTTSPNRLLIPNGITVPADLVVCVAEEVTFKAKGVPGGGSYIWNSWGSTGSPPFYWKMSSGSTSAYVPANANGESIITKRFAIPGIYQASVSYTHPQAAAPVYGSVTVMVVDHTRVNFATNTYVPGNPVSLRRWSEMPPGTYPLYNSNYDSDNDGLPDAWEIARFGNLSQNWAGDWDHDGVSNAMELAVNFNPANADSDGDGLSDDWELSHLEKFAVYSPSLSASLFWKETSTSSIYLSNDTASAVNYSLAVTGNTGPAYSYSIKDSPSGGVWSDWTSIDSEENLLSTISEADDAEETVALGFNFPFFGNNYSSVWVSSNGLITFDSVGTRFPAAGQTFPDPSAPEKLIAPFWDELNPGAGGDIYCKTSADNVVVQYENVVPYDGGGSYTFQVILFSNGNIKFLYKAGLDDGEVNSCAIGIQDASTDLGISIPREPIFNGDNIALLISPKSEFFSAAPLSGTIQPHSVATVSGTFRSFTLPPAIYEASVSIAAGGGQATQGLTARLQVKNTPSTVEIAAYPEGESLPQNEMVYLSATVGDVEGVTRVEFYDGQTLIDESIGDGSSHSTGGFSPIPGNHSFFARVVDIYGGITDSTALAITVVADPVRISLSSPATGQSILQGEAVDISASASHFDGITKVEFFSNATKIGESVAPAGGDFRYALDSGLPHGSHQIVARATTSGGITADSASVTLMVIADTDLDGIPDQWELDHGFNPNDPSDALGDKDGDGLTNREEYRTGSDPALPRIHSFTKTHNQNGTITYTWVSNADLGDWFRIEDELPDGTRKPLYSTTYGSDKLSFVSGSTSYSLTLDPATDFIP
jgi:hypothetical protein